MGIVQELKEFRLRHPECHVVAFGDLSTGMVLAANASEKMTQEKLDTLCGSACESLSGQTAKQISFHFGGAERSILRVAVRFAGETVTTFLAAAAPDQEVLCLVSNSEFDAAELIPDAEALLQKIADDA